MLGTEAEQGKGSLFPILVQKGYVHMALVGRENKKSERTIDIMHLSAFKPEDTLKYCSRKEKLLRLACSLSAISSLCFPRQALGLTDAASFLQQHQGNSLLHHARAPVLTQELGGTNSPLQQAQAVSSTYHGYCNLAVSARTSGTHTKTSSRG